MCSKTRLARLIVIWDDDQRRVRPHVRSSADHLDRRFRRITAAACNDRDPALGGFDTGGDNVPMFVTGQRGALARGSAWHERIAALGNLPLDEFTECVLRDTPPRKWSDERRNRAKKHELVSVGRR